eukprot:Platyproteum_vivax@DN1809_c0_g1_i1.p1
MAKVSTCFESQVSSPGLIEEALELSDLIDNRFNMKWSADGADCIHSRLWLVCYNKTFCELMLGYSHDAVKLLRCLQRACDNPQDDMDSSLLLAEAYAATGNVKAAYDQYVSLDTKASLGCYRQVEPACWMQLNMMWLLITWRLKKDTSRRFKDFKAFRCIPYKIVQQQYEKLEAMLAEYLNPQTSWSSLAIPLMAAVTAANYLHEEDSLRFKEMLQDLRPKVFQKE